MHTGENRKTSKLVFILVALALLSIGLFLLCNRYDNKYTASGKQPIRGLLSLSASDLQENPLIFLVRDWEIYRGKLLSPSAFKKNPPTPDEYTFIGQYGGFEGKNKTASPHGSVSYRLQINLPLETRSYTLELPEIYSAYKLYVNDALMKQMGDPDPANYSAKTGNSTITVQAADSIEIIIAVSDYSYFYSGMVYPPAFGEPEAISSHLTLRYSLRMAALVVGVCMGLLSLCIWVLLKRAKVNASENQLILLYGLLCFCFVGYTCYPVVKTLFAGGLQWYHIENFCYAAIFLLVMLIQHRISGFGKKTTIAFVLFGAFVCCCSLLVPFFLKDNQILMLAYSRLLALYTYISAAVLTISSIYSLYKRTVYSPVMLAGIIVFDCALIMSLVFPNHEPILLGWFHEIAGGVLVALIGVIMAGEIAQQYRTRLILEEQMDNVARVMEMQNAYYPLLMEKEMEAKAARHDLRHHFFMLRELAAGGNFDTLLHYLNEYDQTHLQLSNVSYCQHPVVDMLLRMYAGLAKDRQVSFSAKIKMPAELDIANVDLCVIISNLLENALEACAVLPSELRRLQIGIVFKLSRLTIVVDNSFDGIAHAENGLLLSRKRKHSMGLGLASVKTVAERYTGSASFYPNQKKLVFHSEVLLLARPSPATKKEDKSIQNSAT